MSHDEGEHRRTVGPYRLEQQLGAGGMGEVYRAFDQRLERAVALKRIRPEAADSRAALRRFKREARSAARLNHPNIVKLHDVFSDGEDHWIVMELVAGETLAQVLEAGPLEPWRALCLALELAKALNAAHAEGIVHRDLKAKNVLVTPQDQLKVLDFGLAKQVLHRDGQSTSMTADGQILGTPQAMSPEQAMGLEVDLRSDLFSLGSLLYEMVTGTSPFRGDNAMETLNRVRSHFPPAAREAAPSCPKAFSDLIALLLEKEPAHRPRTAAEVVCLLQRIADAPAAAADQAEPGDSGPRAQDAARARPSSERRQITVLCCQLVSGDVSSGSLDPALLYGAMAEFEAVCRQACEDLGGFIAHVLGHRMVVCFGYPLAREDDARRSVKAALHIIERFQELRADSPRPETDPKGAEQSNRLTEAAKTQDLAVRIGIHTGPAVVLGLAAGQEQLVLGQTLDLANQLEKEADPGSVLVSDATRRLIAGSFNAESRATGLSTTSGVFRIREATDASSQWQMKDDQATPLVARGRELDMLGDRYRQAATGKGQVLLLSGEAGIGKSRLVHAFHQHPQAGAAKWLHAQCSSFALNTPLGPVVEMLRGVLKLRPEDPPETQLAKLEEGLSARGLELAPRLPLFAPLFALPVEGRYARLPYSPQKQRQLTFEAISELILVIAAERPVVLVVEDLHWVDPSTLELLGLLIEQMTATRLLALLTFRDELEAPWGQPGHLTSLHLSRLPGSDVATLIDQVTAGKALPDEVREQILAKTDGVPLYVEELTRNLLESEQLVEGEDGWQLAEPLRPLKIPATLRDSLTERLDRQGSAKEVAQLASVIGREFSHQLLAALSPLDEAALGRQLTRLRDAQLIHRRGFSARARYLFKHALVQDAAYQSLLTDHRHDFHRRIAETLQRRFPAQAAKEPELLAHHYTQAEEFDLGVHHWHQAGQSTLQRSAIVESMRHIQQGLALLDKLPDGARRYKYEVELRSALGTLLSTTKGMADSSAKEAYERALEISRESGETADLFWTLVGLWRSHLTQSQLGRALAAARQLIDLAESHGGDSVQLIFACRAFASTHHFRGEFTAANEYSSRVIALDKGDREHPYKASRVSEDPGVIGRLFHSHNLWFLGYPEQALGACEDARALASRISHTYSLTFVMHCSSILAQFLGYPKKTFEYARQTKALSQEQGSWWHVVAQVYLSWAMAADDELASAQHTDIDEALEQMRQSIDKFHSTGMRSTMTHMHSMLAKVAIERRRRRVATESLDQADKLLGETGEKYLEAEIHRLRGELELMPGGGGKSRQARHQQAESHFLTSLKVARRQEARSLELRTATSLGRLLEQQDRRQEARRRLAEVYGWFTEGFKTPDLEAARRLLDRLS